MRRVVQDIYDELNDLDYTLGGEHLPFEIPEIGQELVRTQARMESILTRTSAQGSQINAITQRLDQEVNEIELKVGRNEVISRINLSEEGILIEGRKIDLTTTALLQSFMVCKIAEDLGGVEREVIKVKDVRVSLLIGTHVRIIDAITDQTYEVVLTQDLEPGDTEMHIQAQRVVCPKESVVMFDAAEIAAMFRVQPDQILAAVSSVRQRRGITTLSADVKGETVTSLPVEPTKGDLYSGDTLHLVETRMRVMENQIVPGAPSSSSGEDFDTVNEVTVSSDTAAGATSIPINAAALDFKAGASVRLTDTHVRSQLKLTSDAVAIRVKKGDVLSEFTVEADGITAATNLFKSGNWNGSVDGNGNITGFSSNASWAITGAGQFEFTNGGSTSFHYDGTEFVWDISGGKAQVGPGGFTCRAASSTTIDKTAAYTVEDASSGDLIGGLWANNLNKLRLETFNTESMELVSSNQFEIRETATIGLRPTIEVMLFGPLNCNYEDLTYIGGMDLSLLPTSDPGDGSSAWVDTANGNVVKRAS